jgi:hypothetical protein
VDEADRKDFRRRNSFPAPDRIMFGKNLKLILPAFGFILLSSSFAVNQQLAKFETRCGWYDNPTPGNHWLSDKDDEWIIGVQGGYQLEDFVAPVFKKTQWVSYFGRSYGYGCACFRMRVDKETKHVLEIKSSSARPLSACRKDKALRKWKVEEK